jgi:hypothetical protein
MGQIPALPPGPPNVEILSREKPQTQSNNSTLQTTYPPPNSNKVGSFFSYNWYSKNRG